MAMQKFMSTLLAITNLTQTVRQFTFSVPKEFTFLPGQFITFELEPGNPDMNRSYSIASRPRVGEIDLCIKKVENGKATKELFDMSVGQELSTLGPFGKFVIKNDSQKAVFIAAGTGIAPFRAMVPTLLEKGTPVMLLAGYRFDSEHLYENEWAELAGEFPLTYHSTFTRPSESHEGNLGRVQQLIETYLTDEYKDAHFYICGLKEMVLSCRELLEKKGINKEHIFFERYS